MRDAEIIKTGVGANIIKPKERGFAQLLVDKIMYVYEFGITFRAQLASSILKLTDQLLLL